MTGYIFFGCFFPLSLFFFLRFFSSFLLIPPGVSNGADSDKKQDHEFMVKSRIHSFCSEAEGFFSLPLLRFLLSLSFGASVRFQNFPSFIKGQLNFFIPPSTLLNIQLSLRFSSSSSLHSLSFSPVCLSISLSVFLVM